MHAKRTLSANDCIKFHMQFALKCFLVQFVDFLDVVRVKNLLVETFSIVDSVFLQQHLLLTSCHVSHRCVLLKEIIRWDGLLVIMYGGV